MARITAKQRQFIDALAGGATMPDAARQTGIALRTAYRYRNDPAVIDALRQADGEHLKGITRRLAAAAADALDLLLSVVNDAEESATVRVRAAVAVLELRARFYDAVLLTERITELENRLTNGE